MTQPRYWLAIDPGETLGWCVLNEDAQPVQFGQIKEKDLSDFLKKETRMFEALVVEEYRVYRHKAAVHTGSNLKTSQVIGKLKFWAELNDIPVVMQPANILAQAQRFTQVTMPSDHKISHQIAAFLHGAYYLITKHGAPTALEVKALQSKKKGTQTQEN